MSTHESQSDSPEPFDLINCGWSYRMLSSSYFESTLSVRWYIKLLILLVISWVPLVVLSLLSGHLIGSGVNVPLVMDLEVHVRFLIVLPLLELCRRTVKLGLAIQSHHLGTMGIIREHDMPRFHAAQVAAMRWRQSSSVEFILIGVAVFLPILFRYILDFTDGASSWERIGRDFTPAGYWQMLVSLPLLYFLLLRWVLVMIVWGGFLYKVSQLPLKLSPTHPDHVGGLGFLGWGIVSFAPVLMSASIVFSAGVATEILQHRESLDSLKYHCVIFLVVALIVIYAPLMSFVKQLSNCRFKGLLEFGELTWKSELEFEEKWLREDGTFPDEPLMNSGDVQAMTNMATCYGHIEEMWPIPFDTKAFAVLILAIVLPMVPLLATKVEIREALLKVGELLL